MKKFMFLLFSGLALTANSQLTVLESGQTILGEYSESPIFPRDKKAALNVLPLGDLSQSRITFGSTSTTVYIGDESPSSRILVLRGASGIKYHDIGAQPVFWYKQGDLNFNFNTQVSSPSFLTSSDARLKQNVETLSGTTQLLQEINPVSYQILNRESLESDNDIIHKESKVPNCCHDGRMQFGFIAQEVQEILPNLVVEDEDGMLAIDYTGFIPLLVDAVKDLSAKVKEQESVISELSSLLLPKMLPSSTSTTDYLNEFELKQNKPNPFNSTTQIECVLPYDVANASIYVFDLQGSQALSLPIKERGNTTILIDASTLNPGMYIYSLVADGQEIDSKRMILTK